jgi:5-formyltetrahydrofolate cyclo-ligase
MTQRTAGEKDEIRARMLQARLALGSAWHLESSAALCERIVSLVTGRVPPSSIIAGYRPVRGEVDVTPALLRLRAQGYGVALPVIPEDGNILHFRLWQPDLPLTPQRYGIPAPAAGEDATPDLLLVPLLAFDEKGHRLGYGKGYYDATLSSLRLRRSDLLFIGCAFGFQKLASVPVEPHDARLDMIVTEKDAIFTAHFSGKPFFD